MGPGGALLWIRSVERCFRLLQSEPKQGESTLIPRSWRDTLSFVVITTILSRSNRVPPVICVCGGKGAGKDIYARLVVNTLLFGAGEVAIIDGDPTNPLFGYPGLVKLGLYVRHFLPRRRISISMGYDMVETLKHFSWLIPKVRALPFHVPLFYSDG